MIIHTVVNFNKHESYSIVMKSYIAKFLFLVWFILYLPADILTTQKILTTGIGAEANPIARYILEFSGFNGLIFTKILVIIFVLFIINRFAHTARRERGTKPEDWEIYTTSLLVIMMGLVIFQNLVVLSHL